MRLYHSIIFLLLLTLVALGDDSYVRLQRDVHGKPTELQTAIARFVSDDGTFVDLVSVIHVGDKAYYQKLNRHFNNYESVLYEMVLDVPKSVSHQNDIRELLGREPEKPKIDTTKGGRDSLSRFQQKLAEILGLDYQLPNIDYTRDNFHHADLTLTEFQEAMVGKEKTPLEILKSLLEASQFEGPPEYKKLAELPLLRIVARGPTPEEQQLLKVGLGALLAESDDLTSEIQNEVVIQKRNKRALEVLEKRIQRGEKTFALFYGAAHMPDFAERLRMMGYKPVYKNWTQAWGL